LRSEAGLCRSGPASPLSPGSFTSPGTRTSTEIDEAYEWLRTSVARSSASSRSRSTSRRRTSKPESTFIEDLGADSLGLVELGAPLRRGLREVDIRRGTRRRIRTVQDAVDYIEKHAKSSSPPAGSTHGYASSSRASVSRHSLAIGRAEAGRRCSQARGGIGPITLFDDLRVPCALAGEVKNWDGSVFVRRRS